MRKEVTSGKRKRRMNKRFQNSMKRLRLERIRHKKILSKRRKKQLLMLQIGSNL